MENKNIKHKEVAGEELQQQGVNILDDGRILVKNTEENKDLRRMLKELTE